MAQLFRFDKDRWSSIPLNSKTGITGDRILTAMQTEQAGAYDCILVPYPVGLRQRFVVLGDNGIRVNGLNLLAGIRVLNDRDEFTVGDRRFHISYEAFARIETCSSDDGLLCPVCGERIERGARCVRCPLCAVSFHCSDEKPCWTMTDNGRCPTYGCPQSTALDDEHSMWVPS